MLALFGTAEFAGISVHRRDTLRITANLFFALADLPGNNDRVPPCDDRSILSTNRRKSCDEYWDTKRTVGARSWSARNRKARAANQEEPDNVPSSIFPLGIPRWRAARNPQTAWPMALLPALSGSALRLLLRSPFVARHWNQPERGKLFESDRGRCSPRDAARSPGYKLAPQGADSARSRPVVDCAWDLLGHTDRPRTSGEKPRRRPKSAMRLIANRCGSSPFPLFGWSLESLCSYLLWHHEPTTNKPNAPFQHQCTATSCAWRDSLSGFLGPQRRLVIVPWVVMSLKKRSG